MMRPGAIRLAALCAALVGATGCGARTELPACSRFEPARATPTVCSPPSALPAAKLLSQAFPREVLAGGCDTVYVVLGTPPALSLARSTDGGQSFEPPFALPTGAAVPNQGWPRDAPIAVGDEGRLYVAGVIGEDAVLFIGDGASWGAPVVLATAPAWFVPSVAVRDSTVAVTWVEGIDALWAVQSSNGGASFGPVRRVDPGSGTIDTAGSRSLCLAGDRTLVTSYFWCNGTDCSGTDSNATRRRGAVAISVDGGPFERAAVVDRGNDWSGSSPVPTLGCHADGAAMVAWTTGKSDCLAGPATLQVSALGGCGTHPALGPRRLVLRSEFGCDEPYYPVIVVGDERELVWWYDPLSSRQGYAVADRAGGLVTPARVGFDLDSNGEPDWILDACPLSGKGFAVLAIGTSLPGIDSANAIGFVVDDRGNIAQQRVLGSYEFGGGSVACDGGGRAHFLWSDHGARYAALVPGG
jgi:hypothetical protein